MKLIRSRKDLIKLTRYSILGLFNTVFSYLLFIIMSTIFSQLMSSIIIELSMQTFRYFGLKFFVFNNTKNINKTIFTYYISILPGSLFLFINIYFFSKYYPPYVTGFIAIIVSLVYFKILKYIFDS